MSNKKKKIYVLTGSRADYYPAKDLLKSIKKHKSFNLKVIVTGAHHNSNFGATYNEIKKDGFKVIKAPIKLAKDSKLSLINSMSSCLRIFSAKFKHMNPDVMLIIGDRYESFMGALASYVMLIPIAHISGGEVTEGALDEGFRHSITKMSQVHFTSLEAYRKRVIQLGENPKNVFNVGEIGLSNFNKIGCYSRKKIEDKIKFKFKKKNFLITFHPETLNKKAGIKNLKILLKTLKGLKETGIVITKSNSDAGNVSINRYISNYVKKSKGSAIAKASLGDKLYTSILKVVDGVIGNSSSGIWEVPNYKIGTINIGSRQKGRIKAKSIIDCECSKKSIKESINKITSKKFRNRIKNLSNPYYKKNTVEKIISILKKHKFNKTTQKSFHDII